MRAHPRAPGLRETSALVGMLDDAQDRRFVFGRRARDQQMLAGNRVELSGATIAADRRTYGRTSGTEPVTVTPGISPSLRTAAEGSAPTITSFRFGRRVRKRGSVRAQKSNMHSWFG